MADIVIFGPFPMVTTTEAPADLIPGRTCTASIDIGALFGCLLEVAACGFHVDRDADHSTDIQALDDQLATVTWTAEQCPGCPVHKMNDEVTTTRPGRRHGHTPATTAPEAGP